MDALKQTQQDLAELIEAKIKERDAATNNLDRLCIGNALVGLLEAEAILLNNLTKETDEFTEKLFKEIDEKNLEERK